MPSVQETTRRLAALKQERSSWEPQWRDVSKFCLPRRSRFLATDANRPSRANNAIVNGTGTKALRRAAAGMMSGLTSPSRPWFKMGTYDPGLMQVHAVQVWTALVEETLRLVFLKTNLYTSLHTIYEDLLAFGTALLYCERDPERVLAFRPLPIGSYWLALDAGLRADTFYRQFRMTVGQLVSRFGEEACSTQTLAAYRRGDLDQQVTVLHAVEPRDDRDPSRADARHMAVASIYWEEGQRTPLRESGYERFPACAPRWSVTGEDVYGTGPGLDTLGDVRQLQTMERRGAEALDKLVTPPMVAGTRMRSERVSLIPGDITYEDVPQGMQGLRPALQINPPLAALKDYKLEVQQRIREGFYEDVFTAFLFDQRAEPATAEEIRAKQQDRMLQLGPVIERFDAELFRPLIETSFAACLAMGLLPPPPQELQGQELKVEFVSILHQAQRMAGIGAIERTIGFAGNLAAARPDVLDNVDFDAAVREHGTLTGMPAKLLVDADRVAQMRAAREQAQAQQAQAQQLAAVAPAANQAAQAAQTLSQTDVSRDSSLARLLAAMGGGRP